MNSQSSSRCLNCLPKVIIKLPLLSRQVCASCTKSPIRHLLVTLLILHLVTFSFASISLGQERTSVAAIVDGRTITHGEVDESIANKVFALQQQLFALRKAALNNLISRRLLEGEATRKQLSVDELKRQMLDGSVSVPPSQVEELYIENIAVFALMSADEAREKLRLDLEAQVRLKRYRDELARLRAAAKVEFLLEEPRLPTPLRVNSASTGPAEAQVVITEFSDFQCPYCKAVQPVIKEVLRLYPDQVRLDFKHLPLEQHPLAAISAQAAYCGARQGTFWQFHDLLFGANELTREFLDLTANRLGLNVDLFKKCLASSESRIAVIADLREAKRLGIDSTPTFLINGRLLRGAVGLEQFKVAIDRELRATQSSSHGQP
jgi:predicted DsbA family dithiol-disulfide isomerase